MSCIQYLISMLEHNDIGMMVEQHIIQLMQNVCIKIVVALLINCYCFMEIMDIKLCKAWNIILPRQ